MPQHPPIQIDMNNVPRKENNEYGPFPKHYRTVVLPDYVGDAILSVYPEFPVIEVHGLCRL
jgi:hypothetical protein